MLLALEGLISLGPFCSLIETMFGNDQKKTCFLHQAPILHFQAAVAHGGKFLIMGYDNKRLLEIAPQIKQELV